MILLTLPLYSSHPHDTFQEMLNTFSETNKQTSKQNISILGEAMENGTLIPVPTVFSYS